MLVSELRANDQIGWRIVSEEEAVDGAKSGKYYAAVVIPKDSVATCWRFYMDDSERAQITYYSNEKKNAISPKITMTGADTVSEKVNTVFAQSISEVMLSVAESVSRYADDMDVHGQIAALADHINAMSEDTNRVARRRGDVLRDSGIGSAAARFRKQADSPGAGRDRSP